MNRHVLMMVVSWVVMLAANQVWAADLGDYKFLKIADKDQRAVVQTPEGQLQLIRVGDVLAEEARIVEIAAGRVVLTRQDAQGQETVVVRVERDGQHLERFRPAALATVFPAEPVKNQVPPGAVAPDAGNYPK